MLSLCHRRPNTSTNGRSRQQQQQHPEPDGSVVSSEITNTSATTATTTTATTARRKRGSLSKKRLMRSTGHNIVTSGVPGRNRKYFSDLYTTLIDIQWRWNICIFLGGFIISWVVFACFYYFQMYLHGDFDKATSHAPCLENVQSFTAAYLFSIETMTTIGYGSRSQTEECPGVYLGVLIQSILGAGLQFALASLVVSKTRRAKRRSETILFSTHLCVCEHDNRLQLSVRVGDMRRSEIVGAHAKGFLVKKLRSKDGTMVPIRSFSLTFQSQSGRDEIFFPWPTQILHTVDEESPLWSLSRDDFLNGQYELIVVLDGICGSTSSSFQARKSYHTHEMKWGYRFATLDIIYDDSTFVMDLSNFHHTVPASTPLCSAQDINSLRLLYSANHPEYEQESNTPSSSSQNQRLYKKRESFKNRNRSSDAESEVASASTSTNQRVETHRSRSMEEQRLQPEAKQIPERVRRCSLGDMIRVTQRKERDDSEDILGDAKNIYRHRKSITDTYLGADIEEECEDESNYQAIMSVVSQRSIERRTDVREVFKKRRSSASKLFFGPDSGSSGEETVGEVLDCSGYSLDVAAAVGSGGGDCGGSDGAAGRSGATAAGGGGIGVSTGSRGSGGGSFVDTGGGAGVGISSSVGGVGVVGGGVVDSGCVVVGDGVGGRRKEYGKTKSQSTRRSKEFPLLTVPGLDKRFDNTTSIQK